VVWGIVESVTQREVKDLLVIGFISQGIERYPEKPLLRMDLGSPNMAHSTKKIIKDFEMVLSISRAKRQPIMLVRNAGIALSNRRRSTVIPTIPPSRWAVGPPARYIDEYSERRPIKPNGTAPLAMFVGWATRPACSSSIGRLFGRTNFID